MSAHASQAFSIAHCTDSEDLAKVPGNESSLPAAKRPESERARERIGQGARRPGSKSSREQKFLGANWPGSEKARYSFHTVTLSLFITALKTYGVTLYGNFPQLCGRTV